MQNQSRHNQYLTDAYLTEIGIERWQLIHPQRMEGVTSVQYDLDKKYRLLLVCPNLLNEAEIQFFAKVLQSFEVMLEQALITQVHHLSSLNNHQLEWVWFADCTPININISKQLTSSKLSEVSYNPAQKKHLWQQIVMQKESR
jgi:DNA polymerase III subunit psi